MVKSSRRTRDEKLIDQAPSFRGLEPQFIHTGWSGNAIILSPVTATAVDQRFLSGVPSEGSVRPAQGGFRLPSEEATGFVLRSVESSIEMLPTQQPKSSYDLFAFWRLIAVAGDVAAPVSPLAIGGGVTVAEGSYGGRAIYRTSIEPGSTIYCVGLSRIENDVLLLVDNFFAQVSIDACFERVVSR